MPGKCDEEKKDGRAPQSPLKKRPEAPEEASETRIENMREERLVRTFLAMLREDPHRAAHMFQFMQEVVSSSAAMGSEGYQPVAMFTLYVRKSNGVTEFKFRPARTGSEDVYRNLKLQRLFELVKDAWKHYADEVFDDAAEDAPTDRSAVDAWAKAIKDQEK